jgi:hypothetical protein
MKKVKTALGKHYGGTESYFSNLLVISNLLVDTSAPGKAKAPGDIGQLALPNPRFVNKVANTENMPGYELNNTRSAAEHYHWLQDQLVQSDTHVRLTNQYFTWTPTPLPDVQPILQRFAPLPYQHFRDRRLLRVFGK